MISRLGPNATRVAALTGLVIGILAVILLISSFSSGTYEVRALFDDVRGLIPGGDVTAGAVTVGRVKAVALDESDQPEVTLTIDDDFRLHEGALADIRLGSNVGAVNRTVDLKQGDITKPELTDGVVLGRSATDQPVNFDLAIETLDPPTRDNIRKLIIGLDDALKGRGEDFNRSLQTSGTALNETANLLAEVNRDGQALRTVVEQGDHVTSALASSPGDLAGAADNTAAVLATTANRQAELAQSVRLLGPAFRNGRVTLDRLATATPDLRRLVAGLDPVVHELRPFAQTLPRTVKSAGPFLTQTRKLVKGGPRDLRAAEPIIDAAIPIAKDFPPVIEKAIPLAKDLTAYIPETIGFFQNFGAATGSYDANGHLINLATGLAQTLPPSTAGARVTDSECTPGVLEKPLTRLPGTNECKPWSDYRSAFDKIDPTMGGGH
ncbi:MAG: phospholipid/cholesterol/gamma-HCH transport system substrate-binding protein [Thermoleophilaceae bacterium]|nr:phospholipid/cholesterol/gamma-HCH transport system substrate-binding protein [Thermoleophilaceae bacterium]